MNIQGKVALVTGGAVRIGKEISEALHRRGAKVAIHYHASIREAKKCTHLGKIFQADFKNSSEIEKLIQKVEERLGPIDILINNAAIFEETPFLKMREKDWVRHMDINLKAPFLLSQRVGKSMLKRRGGKIINIAADTDEKPHPNYLAYSVSKAGLIALTKALAKELSPDIQVNAIAPGAILSETEATPKQKAAIAQKTLLKRWGDPREIAEAVLFFIETDYATGSILTINGGRLLV